MDFFINKVIKRTIFASVIPLLIFGAASLVPINFDRIYGWIAVAVFSVVYPLSQLSLWMLFSPLEAYFDSKLAQSANKNLFLKGNFAAVDAAGDSYQATDIVEGKVPADINGVYVRVGPNPVVVPSTGRQHWFDGDGMLCAVRICDGTAQYCNRSVRTPKLLAEKKLGKPVSARLGELVSTAGLFKSMLMNL